MRAIAVGILLFLAAPVAPAFAQVAISGTEPRLFIQGHYPPSADRLPLTITFKPGLPADITGFTVRDHLKIYARGQGDFEPLTMSGWEPSSVDVWVPTRLFTEAGVLQVKANVDGHDTVIFNVPITPPPTQAPHISSVSPETFAITDGSKDVSISIFGTNIDPWGFTQVLIDGQTASIGRADPATGTDHGVVVAWMPKRALTSSGVHTIQIASRVGRSNTVKVTVGSVQGPSTKATDKPTASPTPVTGTKIRRPTVLVPAPPPASGRTKDPAVGK